MAGNGNMKQAEGTYSGFTALMKWGTIASAIVAAFAIWLIA